MSTHASNATKHESLVAQLAADQKHVATDKKALVTNANATQANNQSFKQAEQAMPWNKDAFEVARQAEDKKLGTQRQGLEKHLRTDEKKLASLEKNPKLWGAELKDDKKTLASEKSSLAQSKADEKNTDAIVKELEGSDPTDAATYQQDGRAADAQDKATQHGISQHISGTEKDIRHLEKEIAARKKQGASTGSYSAKDRKEMSALEHTAQSYAAGRAPGGWCLKKVEDYLQQVSYGKIGHGNIPRFEYAHDFADYLNQGRRYASLGLRKLNLTNPYKAPPGSIIVVRAGTPGTANPVAGDITVKGPGDHFYNDGEMGYGGPQNFPPGNNYVLGIYAPA